MGIKEWVINCLWQEFRYQCCILDNIPIARERERERDRETERQRDRDRERDRERQRDQDLYVYWLFS